MKQIEERKEVQPLPEPNLIDLTEDDRVDKIIKDEINEKRNESKRKHNPRGLLVCLPMACQCCKKAKVVVEANSLKFHTCFMCKKQVDPLNP